MPKYQEHFLTLSEQAIDDLARLIWAITVDEGVTPLVVLSTSGPAYGLRLALDKHRPSLLDSRLVFLPRVLGFPEWLNETPGLMAEGQLKPVLNRQMEVYQTLSERPDLSALLTDSTDLSKWSLAKNIIEACDLLSDASLGIFDEISDEKLSRAIDDVYQGASRRAVDIEAKLALIFWRNLASRQDPVPRQRLAMRLRIQELSNQAPQALIYIQTAESSQGFEQSLNDFLLEYSKYSMVHRISMDYSGVALWPECIDGEARDVAVSNQQSLYFANLASSNRGVIKASSFEECAWAGAFSVQEFLKEGHKHVALIAQDRLLARRIRALLARLGPGLSIHDETGWKLSTTRAAASLMSWVDVLRSGPVGPSSFDLMEFLKNPFINWSNWGIETIAVSNFLDQLEKRLIQAQCYGSWSAIIFVLEQKSTDGEFDQALSLIKQLRQISARWNSPPESCAGWLEILEEDLHKFGMFEGLKKDRAGEQLIEALIPIRNIGNYLLKSAEWYSLLSSIVEDASYLEVNPRAEASITILPLSATRLRKFDAWVMVGCDDDQLPSVSDSPLFLSAYLKKLMGCKTIEMEFIQQAKDLSQLMCSHHHWRMLWQSKGAVGEPKQPSSWLQRLYKNHAKLLDRTIDLSIISFESIPIRQSFAELPADFPRPEYVSPSAYRALRECPYRYYATRLLKLRAHDSLDSEIDLSLVGQTLHAALRSFYNNQKTNPINTADVFEKKNFLIKRLHDISQKYFQPLLDADGRWLAAWVEWELHLEDWINWQLDRESRGWKFHDAEKPVGFVLDTKFGEVSVTGFVDRIDLHPTEGASVIDYKYSSQASIKKKEKNIDDDPQLVIYAKAINHGDLVAGHAVVDASWVSLKSEGGELTVNDLVNRMDALPSQMIADIEQVWGGSAMYANAPDSICQYCQVRGICRKGMWS